MFFPKDFFESEIKCGFEVPKLMKRAWAAQMEVLKVVIDICDRNGLRYYADWGTLLGAVRHKGFIPWDDDIDICLKRKDFRKLIAILPKELPEGFYVAGIHAKDLRRAVLNKGCQLRVLAERSMWDMNEYMQYFHGYPFEYTGIDIFPLDAVPRDGEVFELQKLIVLLGMSICDILDHRTDGQGWEEQLQKKLERFESLCGMSVPRENLRLHVHRMMDNVSSLYTEEEGDYLLEYGFITEIADHRIKKEWYDEVIYMPFENMEIAVPAGYDGILKMFYGDYTQFVQGQSLHDYPYYREMEQKLAKELVSAGVSLSVEDVCEKVMSGEMKVIWNCSKK